MHLCERDKRSFVTAGNMRKGLKLINCIPDAHSEPGERPRGINLFTYPCQALLITEVCAQVMEAERLDSCHCLVTLYRLLFVPNYITIAE